MNLWAWVEDLTRELADAGRMDLAAAVHGLPSAAVAADADRAGSLAALLVAEARASQLPWLEVYARHWRLQGEHAAGRASASVVEVTELFERANRDDTSSCPQSTCVTQDLCIAYAATDGPGFATERIAVAEETMAGIDASWPCWSCLTSELVGALIDDGRVADAAVALDRSWAALLEHGEAPSLDVEEDRVLLAILDGRCDEALVLADDVAARPNVGFSPERKAAELALLRAHAHVGAGRRAEAAAALPTIDEVFDLGLDRRQWVAVLEAVVSVGGIPNGAGVRAALRRLEHDAERHGAWRLLFEAAAVRARLALGDRVGWVVADATAAMRRAQAELRVDAGASAALAHVESGAAELDTAPPPLPVPPDELVAHLLAREEHEPEQEIELLRLASAQRPDDHDLVGFRANLLRMCGYGDLARAALEAALDRDPAADPIAGALGELVLAEAADAAEVEAYATRIEAAHPMLAPWLRARRALADERWDEAIEHCRGLVAADGSLVNTRRVWARAARGAGDHDEAVRLLLDVLHRCEARGDDPDDLVGDRWALVVDATLAGRWAIVRRTAAELGMPVEPGSEPIDDDWELVVLAFDAPGADRSLVAAHRTGPVTARVDTITPTNDPQRFQDLVVFDPAPLNAPPDDSPEEDRRFFRFHYPAIATVEHAGYTGWTIDGFDPGPEGYRAFHEALEAEGIAAWLYSTDEYRIVDPGGGDLPGIYGRVALPMGLPPERADRILTAATRGWPHPLSWRDLAAAAGADVAVHDRIIESYGL